MRQGRLDVVDQKAGQIPAHAVAHKDPLHRGMLLEQTVLKRQLGDNLFQDSSL